MCRKDGVLLSRTAPSDLCKAEVRTWATRIGVEPTGFMIRPMKRKWANCSSKRRMTFDEGFLD